MTRDGVLRLIKMELLKHVDLFFEDMDEAIRDDVPSLRAEINNFNTIGDAFYWMSQWHFSVRGAIAFAFKAVIEGEVRDDEFKAIPSQRSWGS